MNAIIDAWIRRNYAHDVTFDLAPQLQELIAAAVQAEREANREPLEDAARQLKAVAAYANKLPRRYAAGLSAIVRYSEIDAAAAEYSEIKGQR